MEIINFLKYFQNVDLGILLTSPNGDIEYANKSLLHLLELDFPDRIKDSMDKIENLPVSKDLNKLHFEKYKDNVEVAKIHPKEASDYSLCFFQKIGQGLELPESFENMMEQQVELVVVNNALDLKLSHQNILIEFLNQTRFLIEEYAVIKILLEKITYYVGYEFVAFFDHSQKTKIHNMTHLLNFTGKKMKIQQGLKTFPDNHKLFVNAGNSMKFYASVDDDPVYFERYVETFGKDIKNLITIPITGQYGEYGHIHLINGILEDQIGEDNEKILSLLSENLVQILDNIHLHRTSVTDELTQVFNVRYFKQRIEAIAKESLENENVFGLLMIDIDHFKKFNDTHGHQAGDEVLKVVAQKIDSSCRSYDLAARYGGEEFSIIATEITGIDELVVLGNRVRKAVEETVVKYDGKEMKVTLSIGAAMFPQNAKDVDSLIKAADDALYRAKEAGRNNVQAAK